ncbi:MAG: alpha/beta hydrolase [Flavobacteriales bacterium]|nr:alpha/beta hydrolase [Flavobacteriales bacterium]MDG1780910.1 alpha/beta hydrolase [Flavobacteriales bacterium]MDG2245818.1 alpha/beta hydrolase [Flavobacteriales bacterium]
MAAQSKDVNIYLFPGMGADERLFKPISIDHGNLHYIRWKHVPGARTMRDYAEHMCASITTENNIYLGSSLGGMMAREMASVRKPLDLILLSAPASRKEFPPVLNLAGALRMGRWFGPKTTFKLNRLADTFMGFSDPDDRALFYDMLTSYEPAFIHFAINAILEWERPDRPEDYFQLIGTKDALFKTKRMKAPATIEGAGHFMTFEEPDQISEYVNRRILQTIETL